MQELKDLIFIVNKRRLSKIENLDKTLISSKDTLFSKFYQGLAEGKYEDDDDAAKDLYNSTKSDYRYRQLKHRFRKRLLNTLYFLNINSDEKLSEQDKAYYDCLNRMHICNIVQKYGGLRSTTVSLIKDMYPTAEKNQFLEALVEYSYKLAIHYSLTGEEKKFKEEIAKYNLYKNQLDVIRNSVIIYYEVALLLYKNTYITNEHEKVILTKIEELEVLYKSYKVLTTYFNLTWIKLIYYDYTGDNKALLKESTIYLNNYKNHIPSGKISTYVSGIQIYRIKALLINRKYSEAIQSSEELKKSVLGSNWFLINELQVKAMLNSNQTQVARLLIQTIKKHEQYKSTAVILKERWQIYEAYVDLIEAYNVSQLPKYRIAKLYNILKETIKDKAGFNLSLKVLELISLLYKNKWIEFISKSEALYTYYKRHLSAKPFIRAKLFLKLIFKLEKNDFEYKNLLDCEEYLELKNNFTNHILHESEIINYDKLWEIILEILKNKDKYANK
jgi:hypothetical protein